MALTQQDLEQAFEYVMQKGLSVQGLQDGGSDLSRMYLAPVLKYNTGGTAATLVRLAVSLLKGDTGKSAFEQWKEEPGNSNKTIADFFASFKGEKGDRFLFSDFTADQLADLALTYEKLTPEQKEAMKLHFSDLSAADITALQQPAVDAAARADEQMFQISQEAKLLKGDWIDFSKKAIVSEESRVEAEAQRVIVEGVRAEAETARASAEQLRENAEELRDETEAERINAETSRKQAESNRVLVEGLRVDEETKRVAAELIRMQSEQGRVAEEAKRVEEEQKRATAEVLRDKSEQKRDEAEELRDQAETLRASDEADRDNAEQGRITEEGKRDAAEQLRISSETTRVEAEDARIVDEQLRKTSEQQRKDAETGRETAEEAREENTTQAILDTEEATKNAKAATKRANDAAEAAEGIVSGVRPDWAASKESPNYIKNKPEIPTLQTAPGADTISYVNTDGTLTAYQIGDEVRVLEDEEYVFYKLYDLSEGVASWQEAGSGTALPGNVYLQGATFYNESVRIIKKGYLYE